MRAYVNTQLQSLGYKTLSAGNGVEALAIADSGAAFDLLFTDVIMPGRLNGRQLAGEIASRHPSLKVLFTSGYTENAMVHHGRLDLGVLLLAKPYRKVDLARMLRIALGPAGILHRRQAGPGTARDAIALKPAVVRICKTDLQCRGLSCSAASIEDIPWLLTSIRWPASPPLRHAGEHPAAGDGLFRRPARSVGAGAAGGVRHLGASRLRVQQRLQRGAYPGDQPGAVRSPAQGRHQRSVVHRHRHPCAGGAGAWRARSRCSRPTASR